MGKKPPEIKKEPSEIMSKDNNAPDAEDSNPEIIEIVGLDDGPDGSDTAEPELVGVADEDDPVAVSGSRNLEDLRRENAEIQERLLRKHADVENMRKRMEREKAEFGEAARLLGCTTAEVQRDRLQAVRGLAASVKAHVLLKGYRSLISEPGGRTVVNITGNPGLATAGSGDVLTGIIGGLIAQGASVENALIVGAYVHGLAGDLASAELGEASLVATDVIEKLAAAIHALEAD